MAAVILVLAVLLLVLQHRWFQKKLQKLNEDLDHLIQQGIPLPIDQYREGELSILANQMEKITLRLTEQADRVQTEKQYLSDSLADISHQLRTPMTAMNLAATMLRGSDLDREKRMQLTMELRNQLSRMEWLVETLLKISKLDAGTISMEKQPISVRALLEQASSPLAIAMELREQSLSVCCQEEQLEVDPGWTAEAVGNILKNCMEHTPEGGRITVLAQETPLFTAIQIEDTGEGFPPEDLPHLFDRFYQGKNARPTSYGLGLSLARSIVTIQNGTIQARNTDHGASFLLKFYKQVV